MKKLRMKRLGLWLTVALCLALGLCLFVGCTPDSGATETDPDTGLSVGIVIASDQDHNRLIANADLWFGCTVQGCAAAASTAGIIKVA